MKKAKIVFIATLGFVILVVTVFLSVVMTFATTPNGLSFVLRQVWNDVSPYEPEIYQQAKKDVTVMYDQKYKSNYNENTFDLYHHKNSTSKEPTIIWLHGGAFVSGGKEGIKVFGTLLAEKGYTVISLNYEVAPENPFPGPVIQLSELIVFIKNNPSLYKTVDLDNLVIGGDSAGANIAANFAALQTNSALAIEMGLSAVLEKEQLKGLLLYCGPYDLSAINDIFGETNSNSFILELFINQIGWAYFGYKDWSNKSVINQANVIEYITEDFPKTYLTDGNQFSFMTHAKRVEEKLNLFGVLNQSYYPSEAYEGKDFNHEYQFDFKNYYDAAIDNFNKTLAFLENIFS